MRGMSGKEVFHRQLKVALAAQHPELHEVRPQVEIHLARYPTAHQVELRELREVRKEVGGPPRTRRPKESAP